MGPPDTESGFRTRHRPLARAPRRRAWMLLPGVIAAAGACGNESGAPPPGATLGPGDPRTGADGSPDGPPAVDVDSGPGADGSADGGLPADAASGPDAPSGADASLPPPATPDTTAPSRPGGNRARFDGAPVFNSNIVHATSLDATSVDVHWWGSIDDVGVARYCVLRADGATAGPPPTTEVGCVTDALRFVDTTVAAGALYTYAVVAYDFAGNRSDPARSSGHDGQPRVLSAGMTRSITMTAPATVSPGASIAVRRQVTCSPACNFGHNDLHAMMDMDIPYLTDPRLTGLPPGSFTGTPFTSHDFTFTFTAPATTGLIYFYPEAHFAPVNGWNPVDSDEFDQGLTHPWMTIAVVATSPLDIQPVTLPAATLGTSYSAALTTSGEGAPGYTFGVTHGGWLPDGLRMSPAGAITGTPTLKGTFPFRVRVEDSDGRQATRAYTITVHLM